MEDLPRTNNALEGWHNGFARAIGSAHPSIWKFIEFIRKEHATTHVTIAQIKAGQAPPSLRKEYKVINEHIKTIVNDYPNKEIITYLKGVSHNLKM